MNVEILKTLKFCFVINTIRLHRKIEQLNHRILILSKVKKRRISFYLNFNERTREKPSLCNKNLGFLPTTTRIRELAQRTIFNVER